MWSVKADADAYPPDLVAALLDARRRGRLARGERAFLERQAPGAHRAPDALVIETRGRRRRALGVARPSSADVAVEPVRTADTTGAGDAFVAGAVAHLTRRPEDAAGAVQAGVRASRALLADRGEEEEPKT